jgi:hypothetical protein
MQGIIKSLMTVKNFAICEGVTPSYIYKLVKENRMELVVIDGVRFVNTEKFPSLPSEIKRRK